MLLVFLPYVRLINCRFHLFRYSASPFSSQYLLFFKSSRSCVLLFLPTPFTSVIWPSMASWRRQFLLRIWLKSVLFYPIHSRTSSLVSFSEQCIFSFLLRHYISNLSKYFCSNFLSVQISEPQFIWLPPDVSQNQGFHRLYVIRTFFFLNWRWAKYYPKTFLGKYTF